MQQVAHYLCITVVSLPTCVQRLREAIGSTRDGLQLNGSAIKGRIVPLLPDGDLLGCGPLSYLCTEAAEVEVGTTKSGN